MEIEIYVLPVKCSHGVRLTIMDHNLLLYITSLYGKEMPCNFVSYWFTDLKLRENMHNGMKIISFLHL